MLQLQVAVHMDCYKCAKESTGPWYCELCAESTGSFNFWENPSSTTECTLCGGTTGAFRKATNGQWVHAFCAEVKFPLFAGFCVLYPVKMIANDFVFNFLQWSLESTFRRGQTNPVQGMVGLYYYNAESVSCLKKC